MKKTMIITSVRPKLMFRFLKSFKDRGMHKKGWSVALMTQCYSASEIEHLKEIDTTNSLNIVSVDKRIPPYIAKTTLLEKHNSDIYCSLDDDCVLLDTTNYEPVVDFVQKEDVGLVSCNWVRFNTEKMMSMKKISDTYKKQRIVFTGGGMIFSKKIRDILISKPRIDWLFDDVQFSIDSYTSGYMNYRYMGSVIEHNVIVKGGIKTLFNERQMTLNDQRLIKLKKGSAKYDYDNCYYMPTDSNITDLSHDLHIQNKK